MSDLWMPGAERLSIGNTAPTDGGTAKAVGHITWDRNASKAKPQDLVPYANLRTYFSANPDGRAVAPHLLWDPFTGKTVQFFPANSRSLCLRDGPGGTRTNRAGSVVLQVEALFFPWCRVKGRTYESLVDTPCTGWDEVHGWAASWGVADSWPMGRPSGFVPKRDEVVWRTRSGWFAHAHAPENDHTDPGSWPDFPDTPKPPTGAKRYEPFPGASWFTLRRKSPIVARMHDRLVAVGCDRYTSSADKDTIGPGDIASYEAFQRRQGFTGAAAKWPPGRTTWDALRVPRG